MIDIEFKSINNIEYIYKDGDVYWFIPNTAILHKGGPGSGRKSENGSSENIPSSDDLVKGSSLEKNQWSNILTDPTPETGEKQKEMLLKKIERFKNSSPVESMKAGVERDIKKMNKDIEKIDRILKIKSSR
jgi:hypothetical protein